MTYSANKIYETPKWLYWLDPLTQIKENFELDFLQSFKFEKIPFSFKRNEVLLSLSKQIREKKNVIENEFYKKSNGIIYVGLNTIIIDNLILILSSYLEKTLLKNSIINVSIIALGGYGRGELAPSSDIDLLFLVNENSDQNSLSKNKEFIENILYFLWDLGFSVGHSTRTIIQTLNHANKDLAFLTSLIDKRFLTGNFGSFQNLRISFQKFTLKFSTIDFVKKKLVEAENRYKRFGASRFVVEPNVKEGKGGIRDIQTLLWISKFAYNSKKIHNLLENGLFLEKELFVLAYSHRFLLSVRCYLHLISKRENDNLDTASQIEISKKMKFRLKKNQSPVERFMKRYFLATKNIGSLTRIFCSLIENEFEKSIKLNFYCKKRFTLKNPFILKNKKIAIKSKEYLEQNPYYIIELFHNSHLKKIEVHPETLRFVSDCSKLIRRKEINSKKSNKMFLEILSNKTNPLNILNLMNDTNTLGYFVPDFKKIIGLIQHDMYHHYTVDEHTLFAISNAYDLREGKIDDILGVAREIMDKIKRFDLLIISLFLHDIAKGIPGDHSINGFEISNRLCLRFGLNSSDTYTVSNLVLNHLLLSETAFRYDLNDEKIIDTCCEKIKNLENLDLLFALTICDIKAVGPGIWSDWKGVLLNNLYEKIYNKLSSKDNISNINKKNRSSDTLFIKLKNLNWEKNILDNFINKFPSNYWNMFDLDKMLIQAKLFKKMISNKKKFAFDLSQHSNSNVSELVVIAPDNFGLFSKISGIVSSCNINIISAKILTRSDGFAIDFFVINDILEKAITEKRIQDRLFDNLKNGLEGLYNFEYELENKLNQIPSKIKKITAPIRVYIDNQTSNNYTIVEINCKNEPGILYKITKCISYLNLQIQSASISTYGTRVTDIFYVKDFFGEKIENQKIISKIKNELLNVLNKAKK